MRTDYASHDAEYRRRKAAGAPGWDATEAGCAEFLKAVRAGLALAGVPKSGRMLELGCGAGNVTVRLAELGYEVCGVDIAPSAIEWARERAARLGVEADFRIGDVLGLSDFADGSVDIVLDGHCLHCIVGRDRERCLASAFRVLKPGGWFFVHSMCRTDRPVTAPGFDPASGIVFSNGIATRYLGTSEAIRDEVTAAGFEIAESRLDVENQERDQGAADVMIAARKPDRPA